MNIYSIYRDKIIHICERLFPDTDKSAFKNIVVESPKEAKFGDLAVNAAMVLAKPLSQKPQEIAMQILAEIQKQNEVSKAEIAGAGFINITLSNDFFYKVLDSVLKDSQNYGCSEIGKGKKINVEFLSANPTGPMHIGHARNAVVGDVLSNILKFSGFDVTREYYVNDAGGQIEVLAKSVFLRYKQALGVDIGEIPSGLYPGEYLIEVAEKFVKIHGYRFIKNENYPEEIKPFVIAEMLALIKHDLKDLGVEFDIFFSEKSLYENKKLEESFDYLKSQNLLYRGILEPPKGKVVEDYEPREQLLFKATEYGDDVDRPLQKSDGTYTYFSGDIAYHFDKVSRGYDKLVLVLGADHGGYVKRLGAVVSALSNKKTELKVLLSQLVKVVENGEPVKMSKRAGNFITMAEVLEKVGKDVLRFIMLTKKSDTALDFDLKKVVETSKDNPVFYVQYAIARINSVKSKAAEFGTVIKNPDLKLLKHPLEIALIKKIAEFPKIVEAAAIQFEPHRLTFYLFELASEFHQLWNVGKDEGINFVDESNCPMTEARLALLESCRITISGGLNLLGVEPVERM